MRIFRRDTLVFAGLAAILLIAVGSAVSVTSRAVEDLLRKDAAAVGETWTEYLTSNVRDIGQIMAGAPPSGESIEFFERAQKVGDIFLYRIYAPSGELLFTSRAFDRFAPVAEASALRNPAAAAAVLAGNTLVEMKGGAEAGEVSVPGRGRPSLVSEIYVPVTVEGTVVAIMETYVDLSRKHAAFNATIGGVALALAGIVAVAFGLPTAGFAWRTRQKKQSDTRAEFLAGHDALTEVLNRARFVQELDAAIRLGSPVAVHMIDINAFKDINDTHGQAAGDEILRQMAGRLVKVAEKDNLLARFGSDDFALAEVVGEPRQISRSAKRIVAALGEPFRIDGKDVSITVSLGSAVAPAHGEDAACLMKSVEIALSHARGQGRGMRALFRPEMDTELKERRALEATVRDALAQKSFALEFQPIYSTRDARLSGFEALLRLPKAEGRALSPALFVPVAERLGLIGEIGAWALRHACATAATWPSKLSIAVNLSPAQFLDGQLVETVRGALRDSGLEAHRLELEITEGLLLSHTDAVLAQLAQLKGLGLRIAMDDFGTGYSSLSYLWKFPFDRLKIDRSFTRALDGDDAHPASVVEAIVALGRSLGVQITAEGVETKAQARALVRLGCDDLQGFYLGKPMPIERVASTILRDFRNAQAKPVPAAEPVRMAREA